jgi:hypothetical protein
MKEGEYHLVVTALIFNSEGKTSHSAKAGRERRVAQFLGFFCSWFSVKRRKFSTGDGKRK